MFIICKNSLRFTCFELLQFCRREITKLRKTKEILDNLEIIAGLELQEGIERSRRYHQVNLKRFIDDNR